MSKEQTAPWTRSRPVTPEYTNAVHVIHKSVTVMPDNQIAHAFARENDGKGRC